VQLAPRVKIFAGKSAASYTTAKLIIKLINDVAKVVNNDPVVRDLLRVCSFPTTIDLAIDHSRADLSSRFRRPVWRPRAPQYEARAHGALTIGTLDGANIEILEHVGADNIFIFGLKADEVEARRRAGSTPARCLPPRLCSPRRSTRSRRDFLARRPGALRR